MKKELSEKQRFSIVKRAESFTHAWRGVWVFLRGTHNAWVHIFLMICAIALGFFFGISRIEWLAVICVCGFVLVVEAVNTAIEIDIDLTSPEYHPYAKDTKDVAAGAVLVAALTAALVGCVVFIPYIIAFLQDM